LQTSQNAFVESAGYRQ